LRTVNADDLARLVRELRNEGMSEASIAVILGVVSAIYKFAVRRLGLSGTVPTTLMLRSERPKTSQTKRRPLFAGEQLEETIAAAHEPFRTLFIVAALTGAGISELCALTWADIRIDDPGDAEIEFGWRSTGTATAGQQRPKDRRELPVPRELAIVLAQHKLAARYREQNSFVFATGTGHAVQQRNVSRALREAQRRATEPDGTPTFPILHELDGQGEPVAVPRATLPSMHSFRHTVASRALLAGESVDEIAFWLGHRDANVTVRCMCARSRTLDVA
jgi:integrase